MFKKSVLVVSNMYPSERQPYAGLFVQRFCEQIGKLGIFYSLSVLKSGSRGLKKLFRYILFYSGTFGRILFQKDQIIYVHFASHSAPPVLLASKFRKLHIYTNVHGSDVIPTNKKHEFFQRYTKKLLQISEKVIVPSAYFRDLVSSKYGIDPECIFVYPSAGVDRKQFRPLEAGKTARLRSKYKLSADAVVFSFAGRIVEPKGWKTYLEAISILKLQGMHADFILAGSGEDDALCADMISRYGLSGCVVRLPMLSQQELMEVYNISDAFVFPTHGESLGLTGIEAMACGTPVLGSDIAASGCYIKDGYNGYGFKMGDASALARLMADFIEGRVSKDQFANGVKETAASYDCHSAMQKLELIFD